MKTESTIEVDETDRITARFDVPDANRDPITGEPGSHPVGTGIGSAGGAATGAGLGAVIGGPVGAVVGGVVGAIAGGAAGHVAAESIDPTLEGSYWRENYASRPYVRPATPYEEYEPAYRYGWESAGRAEYRGRHFEEIEPQLAQNWVSARGPSRHAWDEAKEATRDSWNRVRGLS
jgi:hypothetical protein